MLPYYLIIGGILTICLVVGRIITIMVRYHLLLTKKIFAFFYLYFISLHFFEKKYGNPLQINTNIGEGRKIRP
jgi:hypothetical protein